MAVVVRKMQEFDAAKTGKHLEHFFEAIGIMEEAIKGSFGPSWFGI